MTFSVIIPCFNCVGTLETTVGSIHACGLTDYEILLIDDGSADGTAELCDALCGEYTQIRCVHQENAGVSAARNRGIDEARGEYIWFVDADDTVDSAVSADIDDIIIGKRPDMLIFGMSFDYYHNKELYRRDNLTPPLEGALTLEQLKDNFKGFYECNALTPVWNKFIRRDLIITNNIRFHDGLILMEDFLFVLELLPYCHLLYSLPKAIYRYRQSEDEKGAYRRLLRINNLAEYMIPFEHGVKSLGISSDTVTALYKMLLEQKLYYSSYTQIRKSIAEHKQSGYAFLNLGSPLGIFLRSRKTQLRHRLAVAVKSSRMYQKLKARTAK